jgi:hypothetical protein
MAEGLGKSHLNKCGHAGCVCTVEPGKTYCSKHCEDAASGAHKGHSGNACECGHDACVRAHGGPNASRSAATDAKLHDAAKEAFKNTGED